ncbi:hypothetical protein HPB47_014935 [Ixodes persulcatus]|uniref:Uncharacterized protein n=1 Tax=Ixodes persulcatus TaxID=34615 RepID=A0AC60QUR2_IXOPE|nr:hypothetical protein HPB47_014935 [Ixodes persulcatus]
MSDASHVPAARSRFTVADDILLLQEVAATNPFEDHDRSGTEEQYSEKEHLLQEINDMAREFGHKVKVQPRKVGTTPGHATGPGSKASKASARAELHAANAIRETAVTAVSAAAAAAKNMANAEEAVDEDLDDMGKYNLHRPVSEILVSSDKNGE